MRSCSSRHLSATQLDPRGDRLQISSRSSRAVYLDMFQLTAFVTTQRREDKLAPTLRRFFGSVTLLPSGSDLLLCPSFFTLSLSLFESSVYKLPFWTLRKHASRDSFLCLHLFLSFFDALEFKLPSASGKETTHTPSARIKESKGKQGCNTSGKTTGPTREKKYCDFVNNIQVAGSHERRWH